MIMKTAWRNSARTPESDIYMSIDQPPEGLAKFECGGDVKFDGYPITVQNLRSDPVRNLPPEGNFNPPTPILHRLISRYCWASIMGVYIRPRSASWLPRCPLR
jgi:hypothetical protein